MARRPGSSRPNYTAPMRCYGLARRQGERQEQEAGSALIEHAEQYAASRSVRSIYLLTTTAEAFFKRLGYERIERSQAPPSIERTREFASLCPTSSAFMVKSL